MPKWAALFRILLPHFHQTGECLGHLFVKMAFHSQTQDNNSSCGKAENAEKVPTAWCWLCSTQCWLCLQLFGSLEHMWMPWIWDTLWIPKSLWFVAHLWGSCSVKKLGHVAGLYLWGLDWPQSRQWQGGLQAEWQKKGSCVLLALMPSSMCGWTDLSYNLNSFIFAPVIWDKSSTHFPLPSRGEYIFFPISSRGTVFPWK